MNRSRPLASLAVWAVAALFAALTWGSTWRATATAKVVDGVVATAARATSPSPLAAGRDERESKGDAREAGDASGPALAPDPAAFVVPPRFDAGSYLLVAHAARLVDGGSPTVARARGPPTQA